MSYRTCITILPNPPAGSTGGPLDPCKTALDEITTIVTSSECSETTAKEMLENLAKQQQDILRAISTNLYGLHSCVFNPRFETSIYDSEDQDYHYPVIPDYEGKLLIDGLQNVLRYSGEDQWSAPEITLYWSSPNIFEIKEHAKIVVNHGDQRVSLRSANKRRQMGAFVELYEVHQLVPYN